MSKSSSDKGKKAQEKEVRKTMIMPSDMMEEADEVVEWEEVSPPTSDSGGQRLNPNDKADFNQTLVDGKLPRGEKPKLRRRAPNQPQTPNRPRSAKPANRRPQPSGKKPAKKRPQSPAPPDIRHRSSGGRGAPPQQSRPRAAQPPQERVAVSLAPGSVRLDPGETEQIEINLQNLGPVHGSFAVKVKCATEGIRTELSQTLVGMDQGARATVGLTIHVPKSSRVVAGQHDFQILIGSTQSRKRVGMAEGRINVTPYERFNFEIAPVKVKNNQSTQITINNEGNAPVRYRISGRDQSAVIDFDIPEPVIEIEPGESQTIPATLSTQSQVWFGKEERHPFEVRVATTAGEKKSQRGTLLIPPRISYLYVGIGAAVLIVLLVALVARSGGGTIDRTQADIICGNVRWLPKDIKNVVIPACRQLNRLDALERDIEQAGSDLGITGGDATSSGNTTADGSSDTGAEGSNSGESGLVLVGPGSDSESDAEGAGDTVTVVDTSENTETEAGDDSTSSDDSTSVTTVDWEPQAVEIGTASSGTALATTQLGDGPNAIVLIGGIHSGFAPSTVQIPNQIADHFNANGGEIPDDSALYILPNLNADSPPRVRDRQGRFNSNGVDLNRNFDCNWTANAVVMGQTINGSGGSSPLSEPEALALERWIVDIQPRAVIVLGASAPQPEIAAGGCNGATPESINLAETFAGATGYFVDNSGRVTGDITDWLASRGIPSIFILISDHENGAIDSASILKGIQTVLDVYQ